MAEPLEIRLLGELQLAVGGRPLDLPASKKTRALLGYLVLAGGRHTRSDLCDLLWDGPADPRAALRWSLTKLRPLVDAERPRLVADRTHVAFDPTDVRVDLVAVRAALAGGTADLDVDALEAQLARFEGELLEGLELPDCFGYAHWLAGERERARELRAGLLAGLTRRLLEEPTRGLDHARAWVALEPLDEAAHARLVELLLRLGRADEARRVAGACTELFERELGRSPGRALAKALATAAGATPAGETPTVAPAPTRAAPELALVGREAECATLDRWLAGPAGVLWVEGAPGVGKSRLLAELAGRAAARGTAVLSGKAYEAEAARPLAIWGEVFGSLGDAGGDRARLFEELHAALGAADAGAGVLVVLDDLQWTDEVSAELLSWLARRAGPGLGLAASVRPGELVDNPAAARLRRTLGREERLALVELGPLGADEAAALVHGIDAGLDGARLFELSGGNPLFAIELARAGGGAGSPRLQRCVAERLGRLGAVERELVHAAAALGRRFSLELAAEVTGLRPGELVVATEELERAGIVRPVAGDQLDFTHDLLREAAYAEPSEPARRLLHRRIARALAGATNARDERAPDLARHASLAGEHELAAEACVAAGERCLRLSGTAEALAFARRGQVHAPHLEPVRRRALSVELLAVEVHAGLGRREPEAIRTQLEQLAAATTAAGEHGPARRALYLLSILEEEAGAFDRAAAHSLAAAQTGRAGDADTQADALANTGRCLAQLERDLPRAEGFLAEVRELEAGPGARLDLAWGAGLLAWHADDHAGATERLGQALADAHALGNHWAAFECASRLVLVAVAAGDLERARGHEEALRAAAGHLEGGSEGALADALVALVRYADGEAADTEHEAFAAALDGVRAQDSKAALATVLNTAARLDLERGAPERARPLAEEALRLADAVGRRRQAERARALLDELTTG